jgi:polyhydroxyalkanoate synthesis regulator phasin
MQEAWRAYLELALGVTEASKKKAQKVAQKLVGKGGTTAAQMQTLTEDLVSAGAANRQALTKLVRGEVERTLSRVGLVSSEEVAALTARVEELERELAEARSRAAAAAATALPEGPTTVTNAAVASDGVLEPLPADAGPAASASTAPAVPGPAARKAIAKKAVATKAAPTPAVAKKAPTTTPATKAVAKKAVAKKAVAKKTVAKKAVTTAPIEPAAPTPGDAAAEGPA